MKFRVKEAASNHPCYGLGDKYKNFPYIYEQDVIYYGKNGKIYYLIINTLEQLKEFQNHCDKDLIISIEGAYDIYDKEDVDGVITIYNDWIE